MIQPQINQGHEYGDESNDVSVLPHAFSTEVAGQYNGQSKGNGNIKASGNKAEKRVAENTPLEGQSLIPLGIRFLPGRTMRLKELAQEAASFRELGEAACGPGEGWESSVALLEGRWDWISMYREMA